MLRGVESLIYDTADDPQFVDRLLRYVIEFAKMVGDAVLETGVGMMTVSDPSAGSSVISPDMFRKWARPYLGDLNHTP